MNEVSEYLQTTEQIETSEEDPAKQDFLKGICANCLNTGFKHIMRNGALGVAYTELSNSNGHRTKQILVCNHGLQVDC